MLMPFLCCQHASTAAVDAVLCKSSRVHKNHLGRDDLVCETILPETIYYRDIYFSSR